MSDTFHIKDKKTLEQFFGVLVNESVRKAKSTPLLREDYAELQREADDEKDKQDKQKSAKDDVDALFGGGDEGGDEGGEEGGDLGGDEGGDMDMDLDLGGDEVEQQVDTSDASRQAAKAITVTQDVEGIVDLLNLIRSGRSLKNAEVLEELTKWLEDMTDAQKLFTVTVLSGIKDIVTAGESAEEAQDPDDAGVDVTMPEEEGMEKKRGKKAPGDATGEAPSVSQVTSVEDTSAPIVVGRRNEAYIRAYRDKIRSLIGD